MTHIQAVLPTSCIHHDAKREFLFLGLLCIVFFLKILFVGFNEIVAIPYDSYQYVQLAARNMLALGPVPPGYSLWLAAIKAVGVPQRIAIELFFLLSCLILSLALKRQFGRRCGVLVFAMVAMAPSTFFLFDLALSDGFYACLNLLALTSSFFLIFECGNVAKLIHGGFLGLLLGIMAIVRNEDPLLMLWAAVVVFGVWLVRRRRSILQDNPLKLKTFALLVFFIIFFGVVPAQAVNFMHLSTSGVYARSIAAIPGHMKLLSKLATIETERPALRFVPVSAEARRMAYKASPTFEKVALQVEDSTNIYQVVSRESGLPPGEIGAGWIWHVFNQAIILNLKSEDPRLLKVEYEKINSELDTAFFNGTLKRRFVLHTFLAAPLVDIMTRMPSATLSVIAKALGAHRNTDDLGYQKELFDSVAMRRSALITSGRTYALQGWAFVDAADRKIRSVEIGSVNAGTAGQMTYMKRPDVETAYDRANGVRPDVVGFKVYSKTESKGLVVLSYVLDNGERITNQSMLTTSGVSQLGGADGAVLFQGVDYVQVGDHKRNGWRHSAQTYMVDLSNRPEVPALAMVCIAALALFAILSKAVADIERRRLLVGVWLILVLVFSRIAFYGLLESEAWAVDIRYMMSANLMLVVALALLFFILASSSIGACRALLKK